MKGMRHVFSPRIRSKNFDDSGKLSFNVCNKSLEYGKNIRFGTKKVDPSKATIVINKYNKIFIVGMRNDGGNPPCITMNNIKAFS